MRHFLYIILAFLSLQSFARAEDACEAYSVRVVTDPVPMQYRAAFARWDKVKANLNTKAATVFIGDSLVENWSSAKMQDVTNGNSFQNLGVGRDRIQNVLWRLNDIRLSLFSPRNVVILLGANNLGDEKPDPCAIVAGLKKTVTVVQKAWPRAMVYLFQILPRGADFHFRDDVREAINTEMAEWGRRNYKFVRVDESRFTCGIIDRAADQSRNACTPALFCENYKPDNLHLEESGYGILNEALKSSYSQR